MNMDTVVRSYLTCALWSSTDDDGAPLDDSYDFEDFSEASLITAAADCADFVESCEHDNLLDGLTDSSIGDDFWLTRNHHGAGFWDRGLGERGDKLTVIAQVYGRCDCYIGDDGQIYLT